MFESSSKFETVHDDYDGRQPGFRPEILFVQNLKILFMMITHFVCFVTYLLFSFSIQNVFQ